MFHEETVFAMAHAHSITIENAEKQLYKRQDYTTRCISTDPESGAPVICAILCDGHGSDKVIDLVRHVAPQAAFSQNPCNELQRIVCETLVLGNEKSGCTALFTKVLNNELFVQSVGDSTVIILKDGVPIWQNASHKWSNPTERDRLKDINHGFYAENTQNIKLISSDTMCYTYSTYVKLRNNPLIRLATTQAIGHDNIYGISPSEIKITLEPQCNYRVIGFSDGVGDMLVWENNEEMEAIYRMSAQEIADFAEARWHQDWHSMTIGIPASRSATTFRYTEPDQMDDVSCFVMKIDPIL